MNNPSYYAIIPAEVRYDESLSLFERFIYCEITALSNAYGYCYANNEYFAGLYHKTPETISRAISKLKKNGYIKVVYERDKAIIKNRKLYPLTQKQANDIIVNREDEAIDIFVNGERKKLLFAIDKKVKENNITYKDIFNIITKYIDETAERRSVNPEIEVFFETLWKMLKSTPYDRKSKVSAKRRKELYKIGDRAVKAIEVYNEVQNPQYLHRRDNFLNEIINNYLDKEVSDFKQGQTEPAPGAAYDLDLFEKMLNEKD